MFFNKISFPLAKRKSFVELCDMKAIWPLSMKIRLVPLFQRKKFNLILYLLFRLKYFIIGIMVFLG